MCTTGPACSMLSPWDVKRLKNKKLANRICLNDPFQHKYAWSHMPPSGVIKLLRNDRLAPKLPHTRLCRIQYQVSTLVVWSLEARSNPKQSWCQEGCKKRAVTSTKTATQTLGTARMSNSGDGRFMLAVCTAISRIQSWTLDQREENPQNKHRQGRDAFVF